jgi:hypothetical protein
MRFLVSYSAPCSGFFRFYSRSGATGNAFNSAPSGLQTQTIQFVDEAFDSSEKFKDKGLRKTNLTNLD